LRGISPKERYDVTIIGGGLSGLTSAALLSRAGLSCCVLEMDSRPGGYLAGFRRHDFRFDSAIHWLNNCGPEGMVTSIFKIIGNDFPRAMEQKRIRRFLSDEFDYLLTNNPDELKEQWIKDFPHEKKGIIRFFRDAKRIANSWERFKNLSRGFQTRGGLNKALHGINMLRFSVPFIPHVSYVGEQGIKKGLNRYFKEPKLHRVFCSEPDMLSCLVPISWAYCNDYQTPPAGGGQSFPEWLQYASESLGADVFFKSKVSEILLDGNRATGVKVEHREAEHTINSDYIVAACDAETLYEKMLPESIIPQKVKDNLKGAKLYSSAISVALGLDCPSEELGLGEELTYLANPNYSRDELGGGDPAISGITIIAHTVRDKSMALPEHGTLTLFMPSFISDHENWKCEKDENGNWIRGEKYKQLKQECADIMIDRVEKHLVPDLRKHIIYCDVATPITHERYTGNKGGTMMGQKPGKENYKLKVASYQTPVENLWLSGHWSELGGGVPIATKSALNTTLMVLQKQNKKVFNLLANYVDGNIGLKEVQNSGLLTPYNSSWVQEKTPAQKKVERREKEKFQNKAVSQSDI
tara:strand:- start:1197 stop:2942 length:1746 start_codon:yes stop_codon:yes gene_type:complete